MFDLTINWVLGIVFFTWHYALFCGFVSDDHATVMQRKDIIPDDEKKDKVESYWVKRFNDGIVMYYQTRIFWALGIRKSTFLWHGFSLGLHLVNVYLLYLLLAPIIGQQISLYACLFWGINPMMNQNVVWVSGRPYLFGLFFSLIAMICWENPIAFSAYYMLALITNISIFFVPVILWFFHPDEWQTKSYLGVMLFMAFPFLIWKFNMRFTRGLVLDRDNFKFKRRKINTFARVSLYYLWCLIVPVRMGWYHQAGFRYNEQWEKFNVVTLIGYGVLGVLIFYFKIPGWWFILGLLPVSNLYATNSFLQDRYLYFCAIPIAIIVAPYLFEYPILFYCATTFYVTRAYMYTRQLKNDETLYRENWRNHPKSDYSVNNLAYFLIQQKRYDEARVIIERGLHINKTNKMLWYNLVINNSHC